jgi:5'-nucleotidase
VPAVEPLVRTRRSTLFVTNDDGVSSPGIQALAASLASAGEDVVVVAPCNDMSGTSAAIGRLHPDAPVELVRTDLAGAPGVRALGIRGGPALAALAARLGAFGEPPDIVVSGVNAGLNTGHSVLHSGTVGAVLTAQNFGGSGLAVSLEPSDAWHWETACALAHVALGFLRRGPARTALNVNVPARPRTDVAELTWAPLDRFGTVRAAVHTASEQALQFEYHETGAEPEPGSDTALVAAGQATITSLLGVEALEPDTPREPLRAVTREVQVGPPPEDTTEHEEVRLADFPELTG